MKKTIKTFTFEEFEIRVIEIDDSCFLVEYWDNDANERVPIGVRRYKDEPSAVQHAEESLQCLTKALS